MATTRMQNFLFQMEKYFDRRQRLIGLLGGKCVQCGKMENLEFDHIDPTTKSFAVSERMTKPWPDILKEIAKCQLLCNSCHSNKSALAKSVPHGGGRAGKRGCSCKPCKNKKAQYMREYKKAKTRKNDR